MCVCVCEREREREREMKELTVIVETARTLYSHQARYLSRKHRPKKIKKLPFEKPNIK